ncbi:hypothetical protein UlMin_003939 [Ulmus minor]
MSFSCTFLPDPITRESSCLVNSFFYKFSLFSDLSGFLQGFTVFDLKSIIWFLFFPSSPISVKISQGSINVVLLGFSSAVISDEAIRGKFRHKIKHGKEVFSSKSHKQHVIKVGTMIRFLIKRCHHLYVHS